MSSFSIANAAAAYARNSPTGGTGGIGGGGGLAPRSTDPGKNFSDMLSDSLGAAVETGKQAESISARAVAGKAELTDVVTAVTNAEVTLQTVVAIRDRVVAAYQEIARMPI
ncbi:MAG: flagellar hook-basal body complex protein FliE [Rhodospirillaceae bacterium]